MRDRRAALEKEWRRKAELAKQKKERKEKKKREREETERKREKKKRESKRANRATLTPPLPLPPVGPLAGPGAPLRSAMAFRPDGRTGFLEGSTVSRLLLSVMPSPRLAPTARATASWEPKSTNAKPRSTLLAISFPSLPALAWTPKSTCKPVSIIFARR